MARLVDSYSNDRSAVKVVEIPETKHWFVQTHPELVKFFSERLEMGPVPGPPKMPAFPESFEFVAVSPATFGTKGNIQLLQQVDPSRPARFFVRRCDRLTAGGPRSGDNQGACDDPAAAS